MFMIDPNWFAYFRFPLGTPCTPRPGRSTPITISSMKSHLCHCVLHLAQGNLADNALWRAGVWGEDGEGQQAFQLHHGGGAGAGQEGANCSTWKTSAGLKGKEETEKPKKVQVGLYSATKTIIWIMWKIIWQQLVFKSFSKQGEQSACARMSKEVFQQKSIDW